MSTTSSTRRFEYSEGSSNKFYEVTVNGTEVMVRWGRIGTNGQSQTKSFPDRPKAENHAARLVEAKLVKGYEEVK